MPCAMKSGNCEMGSNSSTGRAEIKTAAAPRDYNPTLGKMEQCLGAIEAGLGYVNAVMPPIELPGERDTPRELDKLTEEAKAAARELSNSTRHAIKQQAARWWLAGAFGLGTAIGIANLLPNRLRRYLAEIHGRRGRLSCVRPIRSPSRGWLYSTRPAPRTPPSRCAGQP
jgi:hypothetical protein